MQFRLALSLLSFTIIGTSDRRLALLLHSRDTRAFLTQKDGIGQAGRYGVCYIIFPLFFSFLPFFFVITGDLWHGSPMGRLFFLFFIVIPQFCTFVLLGIRSRHLRLDFMPLI